MIFSGICMQIFWNKNEITFASWQGEDWSGTIREESSIYRKSTNTLGCESVYVCVYMCVYVYTAVSPPNQWVSDYN